MDLSPRVELHLRTEAPDLLQKHAQAMADLCKVTEILAGGRDGICATAVVDGQEMFIPLEGVIDIDAERARLDKELAKSNKDISSLEKRLSNPGFRARAPEKVVADFEEKLTAARLRRDQLNGAREQLGN